MLSGPQNAMQINKVKSVQYQGILSDENMY